jgi:VIT1/CCC1 family predicted Fe2+/Mn2+ transporter
MIGSAMTISRRDPNVVRRATLHREPKGMLATARHYVGDLVYGANDGLITTFAVVAGVAGGALSSRATLIIGAANLFADGLSMAVGNYLSIRSREGALAAQDLPEEEAHPAKHGLATLFAFVGAGAVPLLPFAVLTGAGARLTASIVLTFTTLFVIGALRAVVTIDRWWLAGLEMLLLGIAVALAAYGSGASVAWLLGNT